MVSKTAQRQPVVSRREQSATRVMQRQHSEASEMLADTSDIASEALADTSVNASTLPEVSDAFCVADCPHIEIISGREVRHWRGMIGSSLAVIREHQVLHRDGGDYSTIEALREMGVGLRPSMPDEIVADRARHDQAIRKSDLHSPRMMSDADVPKAEPLPVPSRVEAKDLCASDPQAPQRVGLLVITAAREACQAGVPSAMVEICVLNWRRTVQSQQPPDQLITTIRAVNELRAMQNRAPTLRWQHEQGKLSTAPPPPSFDPQQFIARLAQRGVMIVIIGNKLSVRGVLNETDRMTLREHHDAIFKAAGDFRVAAG